MAVGEKEGKEKIPKKFLFIFGFFQKNKKKIPPTCFGPYEKKIHQKRKEKRKKEKEKEVKNEELRRRILTCGRHEDKEIR